MKTCTGCLETFDLSNFYLNYGKPISKCKSCVRDFRKRRRLENKCKDCNNPISKYSKTRCDRHLILRTCKRHITDESFPFDELVQKFFDNPYCPYTGEQLYPGYNVHLDHIYPVSRFPEKATDINNFQWISKQANKSKADLTHDEFISFIKQILLFVESK